MILDFIRIMGIVFYEEKSIYFHNRHPSDFVFGD